jgi:hypothetical protein
MLPTSRLIEMGIEKKIKPFDWSVSILACLERMTRTNRNHLERLEIATVMTPFRVYASKDAYAPVKCLIITLHSFSIFWWVSLLNLCY